MITIFLFLTFIINNYYCQQNIYNSPTEFSAMNSNDNLMKLNDIQLNSLKLRKRICELNENEVDSLNDEITECNRLNYIYRIEELLKECRQFKDLSKPLTYLEFERQDCLYDECHLRVMSSKEYRDIMDEWEDLTLEERLNRDHQRFRCIIQALKVNSTSRRR